MPSNAHPSLRSRVTATDVGLVLFGAVFTALCSQIEIPWRPVPFTMQTLAVTVCALRLGAIRGTLSQLAYLGAGALGMPVFAGRMGGFAHIAGPTGGYLLAFVLVALMLGCMSELGWTNKVWKTFGAMMIGELVILVFGTTWLSFTVGIPAAIAAGFMPFVWGSVLKSAFGLAAFPSTWQINEEKA